MIQKCCENCKYPITTDTDVCPNCHIWIYELPKDRKKKKRKVLK